VSGSNPAFAKTAIIGVGLLGGSLAMALRQHRLTDRIVGCGRSEENLCIAQSRGIIDAWTQNPAEAVQDADIVVLATPIEAFVPLAASFRSHLKSGSLVTDVGSVKGALVGKIEALMPDGVAFVGGHPIAGGEEAGCAAARADLFAGKRCIITPMPTSDRTACATVIALWRAVGMRTEEMDPFAHDTLYGLVSHFPHLVAYALVNTAVGSDERAIDYAGSGFRDATRIALSPPDLWRGIALANRDAVISAARVFRKELDSIIFAVEKNDASALEVLLHKAQKARNDISGKTVDEE